jgi:hypothetical protein
LLDAKLEGLVSRISDLAGGSNEKINISSQLQELQLSQQELARQQKAGEMNTEGGKYLALSKVQNKIE